jgi:hypothetical protein
MAVEKILEQPLANNPEAPANKVERPGGTETKIELVQPQVEKIADQVKPRPAVVLPIPATGQAATSLEKERAAAIDQILEEGLSEVFLKMSPQEQQAFKVKGEETVSKINILLSQTKVKINKIIDLIRDWLKFIPGINKFFLEQETKIKADKIIKMKDRF